MGVGNEILHSFFIAVGAVVILSGSCGAAGISGVNGSFESGGTFVGDLGTQEYMILLTGSTVISGWTVVSSVDWQRVVHYALRTGRFRWI